MTRLGTSLGRAPAAFLLGLCLLLGAAQPAAAAPLSDALRARRPAGGEWFGVYLVDKKVGWYFTDLALVPGNPGHARYRAELVFKAKAGQASVDRQHREERDYEARPEGACCPSSSRTRGTAARRRCSARPRRLASRCCADGRATRTRS